MAYNSHRVVRMAPSQIRFTHENIGNTFTSGGSVNKAIKEIESGEMEVSDFPKIRVCVRGEKYYSLDNRRLYVFRVLEKRGRLSKINVRLGKYEIDELTTDNDGRSVHVRGDQTYDHRFKRKPTRTTDFHDLKPIPKNLTSKPSWSSDNHHTANYRRPLKPTPEHRASEPLLSYDSHPIHRQPLLNYGSCVHSGPAASVNNYPQTTVKVVNVVGTRRRAEQSPTQPRACCCCCTIL